ncbi:MAG: hypothetical protein M3534_06050, partial [Actinomycetota bacterium]|nr:hypothetical protein [Actinomycetota bacterium]
ACIASNVARASDTANTFEKSVPDTYQTGTLTNRPRSSSDPENTEIGLFAPEPPVDLFVKLPTPLYTRFSLEAQDANV